jgi:transcriptional regulator with PAS, ATPase and Fis domain
VPTTRAIPPTKGPLERQRVTVVSELDAGQGVLVDKTVLVGTSDVCDLRLTDPTVSRRHLTLSPAGIGVRVQDLESRNGTWLGEACISQAEVPAGAEIRIGGSLLRIERDVDGEASSSEGQAEEMPTGFGRFLGAAACLAPVYSRLERAAETSVTVLLEGESGTGKELLAEAIHERSTRQGRPFVVVDCGAVSETLLESELFGHERGAFTGADRARPGAFETANTGTVFLDEIGELGLSLQTRLLRVLDRKQVRRLGSQKVIDLDVRVIAATNRNLDREVEESRFRLDLFHRLAVLLIRVPPLREREGDVAELARHFVLAYGGEETILTPDLLGRLGVHTWPGNVRELRNYIERLTLLGEGDPPSPSAGVDPFSVAATSGFPYRKARAMALEAFTGAYVESMLARHGGNVTQAARAAGVARRYFQRLKQKD